MVGGAPIETVEYGHDRQRFLGRDRRWLAVDDRIGEHDAFLGVGLSSFGDNELGVELLGRNRAAPDAEGAVLPNQLILRHSGDRHGLGMSHHPECQIEDMNADVDAWSAAAVLLHDESWPGRGGSAAEHPGTGMVDV